MFSLNRTKEFLVFGVLLLALILTVSLLARPLFIVLFVATLLAVLLKPLVQLLRKKLPETLAIALALGGFFLLFVLILAFITGSILPALTNFVKDMPNIAENVNAFAALLATQHPWLGSTEFIQEQTNQILQAATAWSVSFAKASIGPVLQTSSNLAEMIGIPIITFYFLKDASKGRNGVKMLFPRTGEAIQLFCDQVTFMLGRYIQGQMAVSLISGLSVLAVGWLLGVNHIVLFAFLSAVGEWIPVVGPIVASVLAITTVLIQDPLMAAKLLVFYVIMFKLNHNLIYPTLVGKATKLHPAFIMIGVLFAGHISGVFGMLIIVPTLAILYIYFSNVYSLQKEE